MEKEPLLPVLIPPPPLNLTTLPESQPDPVYTPKSVCLTPSEFKNHLIFGPTTDFQHHPCCSTPSLLDALSVSSSPIPESPLLNYHVRNFTCREENPNPNPPLSVNERQWLVDPSYKGRKSNLHKSKTAPAMIVTKDVKEVVDYHETLKERLGLGLKKPEPDSKVIIRQGCVLLLVYLGFGIVIYWFNRHDFLVSETHPVVDALYFCIVTMCTIGYGDITPNSTITKLFSVFFVLVGFGFIDILLSGMVAYALDVQENHLLAVVKANKQSKSKSAIIDVEKGRMRIRLKVGLALFVVVLCIGVGVSVLHFVEELGWVDSLYLSVMSVTTVGYGDTAFTSMNGRLFAAIWLLVSTLAVARAFLFLAEYRVQKRHRRLAEWVLGQDMTVAQFLDADVDHNGFVSKSEYVLYKLKEMGRVSDKDILLICKKFEQLDSTKCGRITLADLVRCQSIPDGWTQNPSHSNSISKPITIKTVK